MTSPEPERLPPGRRTPETDDFPTGPALGEVFPDFTLRNQHNEPVNLAEARAGQKALVVFQRSARWWPYCRTQLVELQHGLREFTAGGVRVFAVSYDPIGAIAQFCDEHSIEYDFLSDEGSAFIVQLGILNTLVDPDEAVYGIPYPGTYVLDEAGVVVQKFFHREYQIREAAAFVLEEAFGLQAELGETPHVSASVEDVRITAQLHAPDLKFRQRVDLHVRIDLPEGLHVGGSDVPEGSFPTVVTVSGPEGLHIDAPRYPDTVPFQVEGLTSPIPVLEGLAVVRVALDSALTEVESIPVDIEVRYQACNDRECFLPQTVRLHLDLPVGTLNRPPRRT